jgi:hypothetical protein
MKWFDKLVNLEGGKTLEVPVGITGINVVRVSNPSATDGIYVSQFGSVSTTKYDTYTGPAAKGFLPTGGQFTAIYLLAGNDISNVLVTFIESDNPEQYLSAGSGVTIENMPSLTFGGAIPAGANNIGKVDVASLPALPAGTNKIGKVDVDSITMSSVEISNLPALPAGTSNIGKVDVASLPALPAGTNKIGKVDVDSITMPSVVISNLPALPAGTSNIGKVDVASLPALPAGTNLIGKFLPAERTGAVWKAINATSTHDVWVPNTGKKFVITDIIISAKSASVVTLQDDVSIIRKYYLGPEGGVCENLNTFYVSSAANNILSAYVESSEGAFIGIGGYEI